VRIPIFDIDDTILSTGNPVHRAAFIFACNEICGTSVTAADLKRMVPGMIDTEIVTILLQAQGMAEPDIARTLPNVLAMMAEYFAQHAGEHPAGYVPLPGVVETLRRLRDRHIPIGVLTGNVERIGWQKLELSGVRSYFSFGAFGDMAERRALLVPVARQRVQALGIDEPMLVIVGDSPRDIACAKEAHIAVVGVASGESTVEQLAAAGADIVLPSLQKYDRLLDFLMC